MYIELVKYNLLFLEENISLWIKFIIWSNKRLKCIFKKQVFFYFIIVIILLNVVACTGQVQSIETINSERENMLVTTESLEDTENELLAVDSDDFVKVKDYIPDIFIELKYNTTDNFTGQKIYDFSDAYLRYGTVEKLISVQEELRKKGFSLKIWDAFRPTQAQFILWEVCPDSTYVANPNKGFSSHSRGNTVDITIVDGEGNEFVMPTGFDDFSSLANRDYSDCIEEAAKNAEMLERLMLDNGFKAYFGEWWHFTDLDEYPVEEIFMPTDEN